MKSNPKSWRSVLAMVGIILGLALVPTPKAFAEDQQPDVFPPNQNVFGMTYGDWSAAWWQHVLSISTDKNPNTDLTGVNCGVGQSSGPIFFLEGAPTTARVTRTCIVPARKVLFFPLVTVECSTVEPPPFFGSNAQDLRTCAAAFVDGVDTGTLKVRVNGKKVHKLRQFRAESPLFDFIMPAADNFLGLPGVTSGSSVSDGYWLMLEPLSSGHHVIHFEGAITSGPGAGFSQDVTYNLTVTP